MEREEVVVVVELLLDHLRRREGARGRRDGARASARRRGEQVLDAEDGRFALVRRLLAARQLLRRGHLRWLLVKFATLQQVRH